MTQHETVGRGPVLTRRRALTLAAVTGLGAAVPVALAPSAVAQTAYRPTFGRFAFSGDPSAAGTGRWAWQSIQADLPRPSRTTVPQQYRYATAVYRPTDDQGFTQCLPPAQVRPEWALRDAAGGYITRGGDYALDVGNAAYRTAAAAFLVDRCRAGGWSGIDLDEVNADPRFGFPGPFPAKYPNPGAWQVALTGFVRVLVDALRAAGFACVGNIAQFLPQYEAFNLGLVSAGLRLSCEAFVHGLAPGSAPLTGAAWDYQRAVAAYLVGSAPQAVFHERETDEDRIAYALATFLLVDSGRGVFASSVDYSATNTPYPGVYGRALALGAPAGAASQPDPAGLPSLWTRRFSGGTVVVNGAASTARIQGYTFGAASASVV